VADKGELNYTHLTFANFGSLWTPNPRRGHAVDPIYDFDVDNADVVVPYLTLPGVMSRAMALVKMLTAPLPAK